MPAVLAHALTPSSDALARCIRLQKDASPSMVSNLFSGVEYKSLLKIIYASWRCLVLLAG